MQLYCGKLHNFFRFRESNNCIVFDLLPQHTLLLNSNKATLDNIYDNIMKDPVSYIQEVKKNGITNLIAICGNNGVGKSTILESVCFTFFGKMVRQAINVDKSNSVMDIVTCINNEYPKDIKESYAEWLFEEKGRIYKIKRGRYLPRTQNKPILEFTELTGNNSNSLSGHRTKDTESDIQKIIGYDFDIAASSIMFGQNDAGQFLLGKDKDRKTMIIKMLNLDNVVAGCLENIRTKKQKQEVMISEVNAKINIISESLSKKSSIETLKSNIEKNNVLIKECSDKIEHNNNTIQQLASSDVIKDLEKVNSEGKKVQSNLANKKTEKEKQTAEWKQVFGNNNDTIQRKKRQIEDIGIKINKSKSDIDNIKQKIESFDEEKNKKDTEIVGKAKVAKPQIQKLIDEAEKEKNSISKSIAVIESNIASCRMEISSLEKQVEKAGNNTQFVCDKCKSLVSKSHIESEINKNKDLILSKNKEIAEIKSTKIDEIDKNLITYKSKMEKVETWLNREIKLANELNNYQNNQKLLKNIQDQIIEYTESLQILNKEVKELEHANIEIEKKISNIDSVYAKDILELSQDLKKLRQIYVDIEKSAKEINDKIESIKKENSQVADNKSIYNSQIGSYKKDIDNIEEDTKTINILKSELEKSNILLQRYNILNLAFGLDGIQTRIVSKYLPLVNEYIKELLGILSNNNISVKIYANEKSEIDIDIQGNTGNTYNMLSGGEKELLRMATSIGLAMLSFTRTAQKPEIICMDEIFAPLDSNHKNSVFRLLKNLKDKFARIIVISHNPEINDTIDHKIVIEKTDGYNAQSIIKFV